MRSPKVPRSLAGGFALAGLAVGMVASCSGGGGSSAEFGGFQLISISVPPGAVWEINKPIEFTFSDSVDFSTVSLNTINVRRDDGAPATGTFSIKVDPDTGGTIPTTVVFQPTCPKRGDFSDAGLQAGGSVYQITVLGLSSLAPLTVRSMSGLPVEITQMRGFITPDSFDPAVVFEDTEIGPPAFDPGATFVRFGDGSDVPFVFNGAVFELPRELELNLYSDASSSVEIFLGLNQAVDPADANISSDRVRIEFQEAAGTWRALETLVELFRNCTAGGATLRLVPVGILPQGSSVRVVLRSGFADLVGDPVLGEKVDFFSTTKTAGFTSLTPSDGAADEIQEDFLLGGSEFGSLEDDSAAFDTPTALWGDGELTAAFTFEGTGGPSGDFDWYVTVDRILDTDSDQISGGPGGVPSGPPVPVVNGVIDVRNLWIQDGVTVRVKGSKPLRILATGWVRFDGVLDMSGFDAKPVGSLLTPNQPEVGSNGSAGGGKGGTGSFLTSASTPCGGIGLGPFQIPDAGGRGGECGYNNSGNKQLRRSGGGGGGRFGPDYIGPPANLVAGDGTHGHDESFGAKSGLQPSAGGLAGIGPFVDGDPTNDFFGKMALFDGGGALTQVIRGELSLKWAGAGGGAGGDSIKAATFPTIPFGPPFRDKKGAGAGGGGGQLHVLALDRIIFGINGLVDVGGGDGATGENVLGFDHIAGSSGGGSGGHAILESATQIDFSDGGTILAPVNFVWAGGGVGGIGGTISGAPSGGYGRGGSGGPGIIQLHVPDANPATAVGTGSTAKIRLPFAGTDLFQVTAPKALVMIPTFGARSKARSRWIPLGGAEVDPTGGLDQVLFTFGGTDPVPGPDAGKVRTTGEVVDALPALLGPEGLGTASPAPFVDVDGFTLELSSASLAPLIGDLGIPSNDIYLRNPALLKNFVLQLSKGAFAADFDVSSASFDDAATTLRVTVDPSGASLQSFIDGQGGPTGVSYSLIPRFFRLATGGVVDVLRDTGFVRVLFQAATAGPDGLPIETTPVVDWTADIADFNTVTAGNLDFFRFEVEFDLDAQGLGLTGATAPITLDFLRVPFGF